MAIQHSNTTSRLVRADTSMLPDSGLAPEIALSRLVISIKSSSFAGSHDPDQMHYPDRTSKGRSGKLERRNRLQRAFERDTFLVHQCGLTKPPQPCRAILPCGELWCRSHHLVELGQTACVGIGIALDQAAALQGFDG